MQKLHVLHCLDAHFALGMLMLELEIYRARFKPTGEEGVLTKPRAMAAVNVVVADTDDEAAYLFTSQQQRFLGMQTDKRGPLPKPISVAEKMHRLTSRTRRHGSNAHRHRRRLADNGAKQDQRDHRANPC